MVGEEVRAWEEKVRSALSTLMLLAGSVIHCTSDNRDYVEL